MLRKNRLGLLKLIIIAGGFSILSSGVYAATLFSDQFSGSQLDSSKWNVVALEGTTGNEYSIQDSKLRVSLPGGTDGYMGQGMVLQFFPRHTLQSNDVSIRVSLAEISRNRIDGNKDNSGGGLCLRKDSSNYLCITILGNYSGYHPDPAYPGWTYYNTYTGHRIAIDSSQDGIRNHQEVQLDLNRLYSHDLKIYNNSGVWAISYKDSTSSNWNSINISTFTPASIANYSPYFYTWTGDGGYTRKTGSITMDFSNFVIEDSTASSTCDTTTSYNQGYSAGQTAAQAACRTNPASCGITTTGTGTSGSHAIYDPSTNQVHIPLLDVPSIFGGTPTVFETNWALVPNSNPLQLQLQSATQVP